VEQLRYPAPTAAPKGTRRRWGSRAPPDMPARGRTVSRRPRTGPILDRRDRSTLETGWIPARYAARLCSRYRAVRRPRAPADPGNWDGWARVASPRLGA